MRLGKAQSLMDEIKNKIMEIFTLDQLWERIERAEAMARENGNADEKEQQVNNNLKEQKGEKR